MKYPHIYVEIDKNYLVWFSRPRRFFLLAPLAFDILQSAYSEQKESYSIKKIASKYSFSEENAKDCFVSFQNRFEEINNYKSKSEKHWNEFSLFPEDTKKSEKVCYVFGKVTFRFCYGSVHLKNIFHPLFSHLKLQTENQKDCSICLAEHDNVFILKTRNETFYFEKNELHYLKGKAFKQIYRHIYNLNTDDVMLTAHASVVAGNNAAFLLSGAGGSGKSTAAALLSTIGFQILTDDFALICKKGLIYKFPAAVSVKPGAAKILKTKGFELKNSSKNQYIAISPATQFEAQGFPLKKIIFIHYRQNAANNLRKLAFTEVLPQFFKEIWINPDEKTIQLFFHWLKNVHFYEFEYSANNDLLTQLPQLFAE